MKKSNPKIRVFGRRSIPSSFVNRTSIRVEHSPKNPSKKVDKCASFSEFLDSKLTNSVLFKPKNTEIDGLERTMLQQFKPRETQISQEVSKDIIQQFKPRETQISQEVSSEVTGKASLEPLDQTTAEEIDLLTSCFTETNEDIIVKDDKFSNKRKDPFQGMESVNRTGKTVILFGGNSKVSKPMQRKRDTGRNDNGKKQRPTYNHYANGSGFWDNDMEGVDSEEVGHSEVWEGIGSTTFGDIVDWH